MYICKTLKLTYYLFFLLILIGLTSCALTGVPGSLSEAQRNACMAPSANFQALDAIHSTKIHKILWVKKYAKQTSTKELSLSDKCRQTQILVHALYGLEDGRSVSWKNDKNQTSGKIKMLRTHVSRGAWGWCAQENNYEINLEKIYESIRNSLAKFKQPKKLIVIEELPRNSMGKIQKNILRQKYKDILKIKK